MKKIKVLGAALGILLGCQQMALADIVVGIAAPLTGNDAAYGEQVKRGAELAIADINAAGGVLGQKLVLSLQDDACDPKQAVIIANKFINEKVPVVIGHFCSDCSIPAARLYNEEGVLMITPGSTRVDLTEQGYDTIFRFVGRDDKQGQVAADFMSKFFKDKNIAIVNDKRAYSEGLAKEAKKNLNALNVKEVMFETVNPNEKDYSALISKLKNAKVDFLYYAGYINEAGLIVRQMREQGLKTVLMGGDALVSTDFWAHVGKDGAGTLMTFGPDPRKNPAAKAAVDKFRAQKYEPEAYAFHTYGAIQAWAQAVEKAGKFDTTDVAKALKSNEFDTILGKVSFDKKGDFTATSYVVYEWNQDGKYNEVDPKNYKPLQ